MEDFGLGASQGATSPSILTAMETISEFRVAHATDYYPGVHPTWGGAELAAYRLAMLLRDCPVSQFFMTLPSQKRVEEFGAFQLTPLEERFPRFRRLSTLLKFNFPFDCQVLPAAREVLKRESPDILHLHKFDVLSFAMVTAARRLEIPVIFSLYDLWAVCPKKILMNASNQICTRYHGPWCAGCLPSRNPVHLVGRRIRRPFFNHFLQQIDTFIVLSETVKKNLEEVGIPGNNIHILPLPLLIEKNAAISEEALPDSLFFAGWVNPHKGLHVVVEALPKVVERVPTVRLYVAETGADPDYKAKVLERVRALSLEENVVFLGKLKNDEVKAFLTKVRGVVVPEQWGIAWPIFLTEAMYHGRSIVASRIGDIPAFIRDGENGYLADYGNSTEFAEKLVRVLTEPDRAKALGERAREDIVAMTDEDMIRSSLMAIYREVVSKQRGT